MSAPLRAPEPRSCFLGSRGGPSRPAPARPSSPVPPGQLPRGGGEGGARRRRPPRPDAIVSAKLIDAPYVALHAVPYGRLMAWQADALRERFGGSEDDPLGAARGIGPGPRLPAADATPVPRSLFHK